MARICRRVPKDWKHPKNPHTGQFTPLYDGDWQTAAAKWKDGYQAWRPEEHGGFEFWEHHGAPPEREEYMFEAPHPDRSFYQMYETVSEGTPLTPVFSTAEELARYCVKHLPGFGGITGTYDQWLEVALGGLAQPMVGAGPSVEFLRPRNA